MTEIFEHKQKRHSLPVLNFVFLVGKITFLKMMIRPLRRSFVYHFNFINLHLNESRLTLKVVFYVLIFQLVKNFLAFIVTKFTIGCCPEPVGSSLSSKQFYYYPPMYAYSSSWLLSLRFSDQNVADISHFSHDPSISFALI